MLELESANIPSIKSRELKQKVIQKKPKTKWKNLLDYSSKESLVNYFLPLAVT